MLHAQAVNNHYKHLQSTCYVPGPLLNPIFVLIHIISPSNWYYCCPKITAEGKNFPEGAQLVSSRANIPTRQCGTKLQCRTP